MAAMIGVIKNAGYVRGKVDPLRELEARRDELEPPASRGTCCVPDLHPNAANFYQRKEERLAVAPDNPGEHDEAATAIRGLIERTVLTPGIVWGETDAKPVGDLGTILEWTGAGDRPRPGGRSSAEDVDLIRYNLRFF